MNTIKRLHMILKVNLDAYKRVSVKKTIKTFILIYMKILNKRNP